MIARVISAAFERIAVAPAKRRPAFLIVDEAAEYFDDNLETLLSQARKFKVGVVFAHQHLDQLTTDLRFAVAANTSIKLAGGVSDKDARALASDMRTTAEFIASMKKRAKSTEFACHVRNHTENALRLEIPFGALEKVSKMTEQEHNKVVTEGRARFGVNRAVLEDQEKAIDENPPEAEPKPAPHSDAKAPQPVQNPVAPSEKKSPAQLKQKPAARSETDDWRS
jgi:hypothetical protein